MSKIPTKDSKKGKVYFCKQSEEGKWHLLGEATFPKQLAFELMGLNVVNIVYCKDCKHRNDPLKCPYYKFDATDDHDFCSRGEKKE